MLVRGLPGCGCLLAGVAPTQERRNKNDGGTGFDEDFAAVEPVDGCTFEVGVGEEGVPEESDGPDVDREVEGLPEMAAELDAEVRSDDKHGDDVESDGAESVFERLLRGVDGIDQIHDAEVRGFVEEENDRVDRGKKEREIAGPVVEAEVIEAAMRPGPDGTVPEDHERAEEHVDGDGADGDEADIGAEVEEGNGH